MTTTNATSLSLRALSLFIAIGSTIGSAGCLADAADGEYSDEAALADENLGEGEQAMGVRADPEELCLWTGSNSNAGSGDAITLTWIDDFETWRCSVNPSAKNTEYCCTPSYQGYSGATGYFGVNNPGTDGLQLDAVAAWTTDGGGIYYDYFTSVSGVGCNGYSLGALGYDRCWVDNGDHGDCGHMKIGSNDSTFNVYESHSFSCQ